MYFRNLDSGLRGRKLTAWESEAVPQQEPGRTVKQEPGKRGNQPRSTFGLAAGVSPGSSGMNRKPRTAAPVRQRCGEAALQEFVVPVVWLGREDRSLSACSSIIYV